MGNIPPTAALRAEFAATMFMAYQSGQDFVLRMPCRASELVDFLATYRDGAYTSLAMVDGCRIEATALRVFEESALQSAIKAEILAIREDHWDTVGRVLCLVKRLQDDSSLLNLRWDGEECYGRMLATNLLGAMAIRWPGMAAPLLEAVKSAKAAKRAAREDPPGDDGSDSMPTSLLAIPDPRDRLLAVHWNKGERLEKIAAALATAGWSSLADQTIYNIATRLKGQHPGLIKDRKRKSKSA